MVMALAMWRVMVGLPVMAFWYNSWHSLSVKPAEEDANTVDLTLA